MNDATIGTWSYRAGDWFAVFGANTTLLLPASERDRVVGLWALVDGGAGFGQVLDGLLASGLSTLQGFVLVGADVGPTRILLRGDGVRATLTTAAETVELEGTGSSTWVERTVDDVTALTVSVSEERPRAGLPHRRRPGARRPDRPPAGGSGSRARGRAGARADRADRRGRAVADRCREQRGGDAGAARGHPRPPATVARAGRAGTGSGASREEDPLTAHMPVAPPPPPPPPPFGDLPPPPPAPSDSPFDAPEEVPDAGDSDHDGMTQAGVDDDEFAREQPGIPGQPMAPSITRPVAKLIVSNGETVDVDRVVLIGRAPEARRFTSTEQPTLVTVPSPHARDLLDPRRGASWLGGRPRQRGGDRHGLDQRHRPGPARPAALRTSSRASPSS